MFFMPYDYWKALFFIKVYRYPKGFSNLHVVLFETGILKEIRTLRYPYNNSIILIPNFQNKLCSILDLINFLN